MSLVPAWEKVALSFGHVGAIDDRLGLLYDWLMVMRTLGSPEYLMHFFFFFM